MQLLLLILLESPLVLCGFLGSIAKSALSAVKSQVQAKVMEHVPPGLQGVAKGFLAKDSPPPPSSAQGATHEEPHQQPSSAQSQKQASAAQEAPSGEKKALPLEDGKKEKYFQSRFIRALRLPSLLEMLTLLRTSQILRYVGYDKTKAFVSIAFADAFERNSAQLKSLLAFALTQPEMAADILPLLQYTIPRTNCPKLKRFFFRIAFQVSAFGGERLSIIRLILRRRNLDEFERTREFLRSFYIHDACTVSRLLDQLQQCSKQEAEDFMKFVFPQDQESYPVAAVMLSKLPLFSPYISPNVSQQSVTVPRNPCAIKITDE